MVKNDDIELFKSIGQYKLFLPEFPENSVHSWKVETDYHARVFNSINNLPEHVEIYYYQFGLEPPTYEEYESYE
jgi:hypothetical protein